MKKINYNGIELLQVNNTDDNWFVNRSDQRNTLGIYAGYTLKNMKELIDEKTGKDAAGKILDDLVVILLKDDWKEKGIGWKISAILGKVKALRRELKRLNKIMNIAGIA